MERRKSNVTLLINEEKWSRKKSVVTLLPPHVGAVPLVNEELFRTSAKRQSFNAGMSRQRSALTSARRRSVTMDTTQFVYLVDPQRNDPVLREQKQRLLKTLLKYESPRPSFATERRRSSTGTDEIDDDVESPLGLRCFKAFGDDDDDDASAKHVLSHRGSGAGGSHTQYPELEDVDGGPQIAVTCTSPRKSVPNLRLALEKSPRSPRSTRVDAAQRRKSLKALMMMPADVLSGLGSVEETLEAIGDDSKLLGLEEHAEQLMSARLSRRHKTVASPGATPRQAATPGFVLPDLPPVVHPDFAAEVEEVLKHFSPMETLQEMLNTITDTVHAFRFDLVGLLNKDIESYLVKQQGVTVAALNAAKKLLEGVAIPKALEQTRLLQSTQEDLAMERRLTARARAETSKIQSSMRQYGIVPAKWGVLPPPPESCVVLCCDLPLVNTLWKRDPVSVRTSMKLIVELQRKLIREMKSAYEVQSDGTSFLMVFASSKLAVDWALAFHVQLLGLSWPASLLQLEPCQADAKLLWKGISARIAIHRGGMSTSFDPELQCTYYFGEALRVASSMMSFCPPGAVVASEDALESIADLKDLATHGGGFGIPFTAEVEGAFMRMTRLVPHSLKGRLDRFHHSGSTGAAHPTETSFLLTTLRPSDYTVRELPSADAATDSAAEQVCVANEFFSAIEEDEEMIKQLTLCVDLNNVPDGVMKLLDNAERAGIPVATIFVQIVDAAKAFEKHRPSLLPTVRTLLGCVKKAVRGLTSGTDIACVGETVSLVFAARTDAVTFMDRFLSFFYHAKWHPDTLTGWALAFPNTKEPSPEVVIGGHYGPLHKSLDCDDGRLVASMTAQYASLTQSLSVSNANASMALGAGSKLLGGYAASFDTACAFAAFALPGEVILSSALAESCASNADSRGIGFMELGLFSIQNPRYEGILFAGVSNAQRSRSSNGSSLHSSVTAEGACWPSSKTVAALVGWLPTLHDVFQANQRAMAALLSERSINQMRRPPGAKNVVTVACEVYIPKKMWDSRRKFLVLDALKSYQRCVRGLLTELEDGYEVFCDPQCFFLAFASQTKAVRFALGLQDKLMSLFWPPAFVDEFKPFVQRVTTPDGVPVWCGLRARVAVVTPPETFVDTLPSSGVTSYFGYGVRWCTALCSVAQFGQTLLDQATADAMQSFFQELGEPTIDFAASVLVPGRAMPLKTYSLSSTLLKRRSVDPCDLSMYHEASSLLAWYVMYTKEDTPVSYVLSGPSMSNSVTDPFGASANKVGRANSIVPGLFEQLAYSDFGTHSEKGDPFLKSASSEPAPGPQRLTPLPASVSVTPRVARGSSSHLSPTHPPELELPEMHTLQDELTRVHRLVKRLLDQVQGFLRQHLGQGKEKGPKTEEEIARSIIHVCKELGVHWKGESKPVDKAFVALCNAVLPVDSALGGSASGQVSRQASGIGPAFHGPAPPDFTASVAGMVCIFFSSLTMGAKSSALTRRLSMTQQGIAHESTGVFADRSETPQKARRKSVAQEGHLNARTPRGAQPHTPTQLGVALGQRSSATHHIAELDAKPVLSDTDSDDA